MAKVTSSARRSKAQSPKGGSAASAEAKAPRAARGRPVGVSNERLLEVAREVFLEQGIRATTAEVARRAGVAEGTLFHRFKSKDALFRAAMRFDPDAIPMMLQSLATRAGQGELRSTLIEFAQRLLEVGRVALPVMMMSWSNPTGEFSLERMLARGAGYRQAFHAMCGFFQIEMDAGRLRQIEPELLARLFMGSLHHYCMTELFLITEGKGRLAPSEFAHGLVDLLLSAAGSAKKHEVAGDTTRQRWSRL